MDGFKNTTKTSYDTASGRKFANGGMTVSRNDMAGGQGPMSKPAMVAKYAKGGSVKKAEQKVGRVMKEFSEGKLHSGSKKGPEVKNPKQAIAIALSEAGKSKKPVKRAEGTPIGKGPEGDDVLMARMTKEELAQGARGVRMARERLERQAVKRGVPPANRTPLISERMQDVGRSIGAIKKAGGGEVARQAPTTTSNPADYSGPPAPVTRAKAAPVVRSPKPVGPKFGMYMNSAPSAPKPQNMGGNTMLRRNKGGLSAMPKGKGC